MKISGIGMSGMYEWLPSFQAGIQEWSEWILLLFLAMYIRRDIHSTGERRRAGIPEDRRSGGLGQDAPI